MPVNPFSFLAQAISDLLNSNLGLFESMGLSLFRGLAVILLAWFGVKAALSAIDGYVAERATTLFGPVIEHLREVRETRSCSEIESHFERNFGVSGVTTACEYLADQGLIGKASTPVRLTKKSNVEVQELAFFYIQ